MSVNTHHILIDPHSGLSGNSSVTWDGTMMKITSEEWKFDFLNY